MPERRYNEDEVALILRAAVDATQETDVSQGKGLTLAALEETGAQVGIEPARIAEAARALDRGAPTSVGTVLGMPTTLELERVAAVRLRPEDLPRLLDLIRSGLHRQGIVEEVLGGFEWRARGGLGGRYVSIRPEGEQTRIRILGNFRDGLTGMTLGAGPVAGVATLGLVSGLGLAGLAVAAPLAVAGAAVAAFAPWRFLFEREAGPLRSLLDVLERELLASAARDDG